MTLRGSPSVVLSTRVSAGPSRFPTRSVDVRLMSLMSQGLRTDQLLFQVEDDVAECVTVQDRMCKEETSGYTTQEKCEDWPRQECTVVKKKVSQSPEA